MDVVDGNCVLCTNTAEVLDSKFCKHLLALLKVHYFEVNKKDFKQFSKLFDSRNEIRSFCVPCSINLNTYFETRNACNQANKTGTSGRTCSFCNNSDYVTKSSKQLNDDFELVFKGIKKTTRNINYVCFRCLLSVNVFKEIKESITKLLESEDSNDSDNSKSESEETTNMKKSKSSHSLRKRKINDNQNKNESLTPKRLKTDTNKKVTVENKKSKKSTRNSTNALERKLKHLNNVNAETEERDMRLSYQVVTDKKMMFDIPFVNCHGIESPKSNGKTTRQKAKKQKLSNDEENVIDISSTDEQEEMNKNTRSRRNISRKLYKTRNERAQRISSSGASGNDSETTSSQPKGNVSKKSPTPTPTKQVRSKRIMAIVSSDDDTETSSKRSVPQRKSKVDAAPPEPKKISSRGRTLSTIVPTIKSSKIKLKAPVKIPNKKKITFNCNKCTKVLKMKYMVVLHELEHDCSYSPMISVEKRDLLALKENLKLQDKTDEIESVSTDSTENTVIEKDMEENDDEDLELGKLRFDEENEIEDHKDATEELDTADQKVDEIDESTEKQDEEKEEKDEGKEEKEEKDEEKEEKDEEKEEKVEEKEEKDETNDDEVEEKIESPKAQKDSNEDIEDTPVIKGSSDTEDNILIDETSTQETDTTNIEDKQNGSNDEDVDAVDNVNSSKEDVKEQKDLKETDEEPENDTTMQVDKDFTSPIRASKSPSPKKDDDDVDSEKPSTKSNNDNTVTEEISDEKSKDIPKGSDKNVSPISSDNESNTEPNDNVSKGSDFSDNDNDNDNKQLKDTELKSNGCESEEFTLKLSSSEDSLSPGKKNTSNQENDTTNNIISEESINSVQKSIEQDAFQMVENILQNLGA